MDAFAGRGVNDAESRDFDADDLEGLAKAWRALAAALEASLGTDHWRTGDATRVFGRVEAHLARPEEERRRLGHAQALDARAGVLSRGSEYAAAVDEIRKALAIRRQVLGDAHRESVDTAIGLGKHLAALAGGKRWTGFSVRR